MKLSSFNFVATYVEKLDKLKAAKDATQYGSLKCIAYSNGSPYDITELLGKVDLSEQLEELIELKIRDVKAVLATHGVTDE